MNLSDAVVLLERDIKNRADITLKGTVRIRDDYWHPPVCQNYKTESGCKLGEKCVFSDKEVDSLLNQKATKSGGKGSDASSKNS